jgi:replicative DNA helicase
VLALDERGQLRAVPVSGFHDNGVRATYRLTTRSGRSIEVTDNHPFLTGSGWRELRSLAIGDRVAAPRELAIWGTQPRADAEIVLLAYLIGDGCLRGGAAELTTASPVIEAEAIAAAAAFGAEAVVTPSPGALPKVLRFNRAHERVRSSDVAEPAGVSPTTVWGVHRERQTVSVSAATRGRVEESTADLGDTARHHPDWLRIWLEELGLWGRASHDKFVPDVVFTLPRDQVALFLSRLFATDGSAWVAADNGCFSISYCSVSERLVHDVQHLLLRFGILSRIRERQVRYLDGTHRAFELEIRDAVNARRFLTEIGIFSRQVPCPTALDSDSLRDVASSDVLWDQIVAIEPAGEERVYDLTVPGLHNFVADDLIVHNSSLSLNLAQYVSVELRKPAILFSLEMSKLEIVNRMLSAEARIESTKLRTGKLDDLDWRKLSDSLGKLSDAPLFIDDTPSITLMEIRAKCRRLKQREGLDLVIVDYLQLMSSHARVDSRQQEVAEFSRGLKMLAKELDVPVIALSQLSRQPEARTDKRPLMSDLRESGSLEQDADIVAFIYRDEVYDEDSPDRGIAELIVSKHRNGATGVVKLAFLNHLTKFANLARGTSGGGGGAGGGPTPM